MKLKIFCRFSLFPYWSGEGLISTPVGVVTDHTDVSVVCAYFRFRK